MSKRRLLPWAVALLGLVAFGFLTFARTLDRDLNHDENQFLAPAALLSRESLLATRDFPAFHLPNLTFVYAAAFRLQPSAIIAAKLVSWISTLSLAAAIATIAARYASPSDRKLSAVLPLLPLLLLLADPLFLQTTGKTWNHELPAFLAIFGALLVLELPHNRAASLSAGVLLGLATGTRLTFAPLAFGMGLLHFLRRSSESPRDAVGFVCFSAGIVVGLGPTLYVATAAPERFWFDNFRFPRLRLVDPTNTRIQKTVSLWRKIRFLFKEVLVPSWPVSILFATATVPAAIKWFRRRETAEFTSAAVVWLMGWGIVGCFAPSRYQYQHFYVLIPLLVLGIVYAVCRPRAAASQKPWLKLSTVLICCAGAIYGLFRARETAIAPLAQWARGEEMFTDKARAFAENLRPQVTRPGRVLTLAPAWAVEAGLPIYPEFATGVFAWRSADLLDPTQRQRYQLVGPTDLEAYLAKQPPAAILTGVEEPELEKPIVDYAKAHGFERRSLKKGRELWLPPNP